MCPWFATKYLVYALSGPRAILLLDNAKSRLYFIQTVMKTAWFSILTKPSSTSGQSLLESPSILINTLLPPLKNNNAFFLFCTSGEQFTAALVWHSAAWWELGLCIVSTHSLAVRSVGGQWRSLAFHLRHTISISLWRVLQFKFDFFICACLE